jgi:NAD-dependent deacetylase
MVQLSYKQVIMLHAFLSSKCVRKFPNAIPPGAPGLSLSLHCQPRLSGPPPGGGDSNNPEHKGEQQHNRTMNEQKEFKHIDMNQRGNISNCARLIANAKRVIIFTGAGMSAESGIETFRGSGGFWTGYIGQLALAWFGTPVGWKWTPGIAWSQYVKKFFQPIAIARPNPGHIAIAQLQAICRHNNQHMCIITQNVDGLHQRAGNDPALVYELHGSVWRYKCIAENHPNIVDTDNLPTSSIKCSYPECNSTLRPDFVLFTEALPEDPWSKAEEAVRSLQINDVMLVIGTSAKVYPAAELPLFASRNAHIIEINLEESSFNRLNNYYFLRGRAGEVLQKLVDEVKEIKENIHISSSSF